MARQAVESTTLPPGSYFVGDPCYAVPDDEWMPYLEHGGDHYEIEGMVITLKRGRLVASVNTAFGDGVYEGSDGNEYPVDAGLLGAVQLLPGEQIDRPDFGTVVEFAEPFTVSYESGTVFVGMIAIDTDPQDDQCGYCGGVLDGFGSDEMCSDCVSALEEEEAKGEDE